MTVREFLVRKKRLANIVQWTPVLMLFVFVAVHGPREGPTPLLEQAGFAIAIGLPYCFLFAFTSQWPKCPRCGFNMFAFKLRKRKKHQVDFCPHCSQRLDERMTGSMDRGWP